MNRIIVIVLIMTGALMSCVKKNTPEVPLNNNVDTTLATPQQKGVFMNGPYGSVSGRAIIYNQNGRLILGLQDMRISNGPQLHVYLSKEVQPVNFIDLGPLQSTLGNQVYNINNTVDFSEYRYALVHCKKYNHLFGSAELR
ncbi:MAG TPA: DM13 domain-containing protein [Chitinophagaceae bacterium]|nr:DM13 domain-containing protein [Chitinophagaceae bacterium]